MTKTTLLCGVLAAMLLAAVPALSQNTGTNVRLGGSVRLNDGPEVIDMSWARPYLDGNATLESNATHKDDR